MTGFVVEHMRWGATFVNHFETQRDAFKVADILFHQCGEEVRKVVVFRERTSLWTGHTKRLTLIHYEREAKHK